jgi:extracellular factor (EF) 3-hydroxypalmitic acid methyl ester biosynthesis protein
VTVAVEIPIDVVCGDCARGIAGGEIESAMAGFVAALAEIRAAVPHEHWRRIAATIVAHPVHGLMMNDPYTAAAFGKGRGYAGDASTLDFVYRHRCPPSETTPLGRRLFQITTDVPIACAVRARTRYLADLVAEKLAVSPDATIVSIACGHMRELDAMDLPATERAHVYGFDHDPITLEQLTRTYGTQVAAKRASVRHLLSHPDIVPAADLIYAAGLFDYLEDRAASLLIRRLHSRLAPGGTLVVTNLTECNSEVAYMESVMDWWMVYRDEEALRTLSRADRSEMRTRMLVGGRVSCLELQAHR